MNRAERRRKERAVNKDLNKNKETIKIYNFDDFVFTNKQNLEKEYKCPKCGDVQPVEKTKGNTKNKNIKFK